MPAQTVGFVVKGMAEGSTLNRQSERAGTGILEGRRVYSATSSKNCEGPEMLPTYRLTSEPTTVSWMLEEDMRLLGQR